MRLLIVDDHPIVISACRSLFAHQGDIYIGEAHSLLAARSALGNAQWDIIVLDINLPDGSGLAFAKELHAHDASTRIIIFSVADSPMIALQAIQSGARGFVSKSGESQQLLDAVRTVALDGVWLSDELAQELAFMKVRGNTSDGLLSEREQEIMRDLARGQNFQQIAKKIAVSYWAVVKECETLKNKLNARNASELIRIAVELKLV